MQDLPENHFRASGAFWGISLIIIIIIIINYQPFISWSSQKGPESETDLHGIKLIYMALSRLWRQIRNGPNTFWLGHETSDG